MAPNKNYSDGLNDAAKKCDEMAEKAEILGPFDKYEYHTACVLRGAAAVIRELIQSE